MVDTPEEFEVTDRLGTTDEYSGSVGTTAIKIPGTAGNVIDEIDIRCAVDQPFATRLEYSYDNVNYKRLRVGESKSDEPRGNITQVWIRAAGSGITAANYEIIMNRGQ